MYRYRALVQPFFDYCCEVWDSVGKTLTNKLQTLQNRAARVILDFKNGHARSEAALTELGWKTLNERRLLMKARLIYKITHDIAAVRLAEILNMSSASQHHYNLRNSDMKLYLSKPKTDYVKKSQL